MKPRDVCMACDKKDKACKQWNLNSHYGSIYCADCQKSGNLKKSLLQSIEKQNMIPCLFLMNREFAFYRHSQSRVEHAKLFATSSRPDDGLIWVPPTLLKEQKEYGVRVSFGSDSQRVVLLANLFKHTNGLLEDFSSCRNIFGDNDEIIIAPAELPLSIIEKFRLCKAKADATESNLFIF